MGRCCQAKITRGLSAMQKVVEGNMSVMQWIARKKPLPRKKQYETEGFSDMQQKPWDCPLCKKKKKSLKGHCQSCKQSHEWNCRVRLTREGVGVGVGPRPAAASENPTAGEPSLLCFPIFSCVSESFRLLQTRCIFEWQGLLRFVPWLLGTCTATLRYRIHISGGLAPPKTILTEWCFK